MGSAFDQRGVAVSGGTLVDAEYPARRAGAGTGANTDDDAVCDADYDVLFCQNHIRRGYYLLDNLKYNRTSSANRIQARL